MQFDVPIIAVHLASSNGISLTIVSFADATVSVFSDFHFALTTIALPAISTHISVSGETVYLLLEDGKTVCRYGLPFLLSQSQLIRATSGALASYWHHHDVVEGAHAKLEEIWKRIWEEAAPFTTHGIEIAQAFLCGRSPPELSTEVHRGRVRKSIANEIGQLRKIIAQQIVPSFLELDRSTEKLQAVLDFEPEIGIELKSTTSDRQLRNCLSMLENLRKLDACFSSLFEYLQDGGDAALGVSTTEFAEFLVRYLRGFDLLDIAVGEGPARRPVFAAEPKQDIDLPSRYSSMRGQKCVCLSDVVTVIDMNTGERTEYEPSGTPVAGFPFDDDTIGCFCERDGRVMFGLFNSADEGHYEVSLLDAITFVTSPRKIAFIESAQSFCAVVDLQPSPDEEPQDEADE
jgi:hypothetical protein